MQYAGWSQSSLKRSDFHYVLPSGLIAQQPLERRSDSRLLHLSRDDGGFCDRSFRDLPSILREDDLLVFNDTRVIPARLHGRKETGGKVEIMLERLLSDTECLAQLRVSKSPQPGSKLLLEDGSRLEIIGREGSFFHLRLLDGGLAGLLRRIGHIPLPPYITREDTAADAERYQTVYATNPGAVAAPTAGLHFDRELLEAIDRKGIGMAYLTLHVGAGTFQPVRSENIENHKMHAEYLEVSASVCAAIEQAKNKGGRIIAVGTTSVRSLETAAADGTVRPFSGDSRIFIYPAYEFKVIDGLITNFHLPESTLLMLVCALAGLEETRAAYTHAVQEQYRFFSYGDAMLVL